MSLRILSRIRKSGKPFGRLRYKRTSREDDDRHCRSCRSVADKDGFGYDPDVKRPEYSLSEAKELMEEAGYADGFTVKFPIVSLRENVGQFIKDSGKII